MIDKLKIKMKNKEALTAGKKETRTKRKTDKKFTIKRERLSSWKNFKHGVSFYLYSFNPLNLQEPTH